VSAALAELTLLKCRTYVLGIFKILKLQTESNTKLYLRAIRTEQVLVPGWWLEPSLLHYHSDHKICLLYSICSE